MSRNPALHLVHPLFSISVICKNEENSIPNLHASLKEYIELGGEIVIIDTGSTDKTIEVIQRLGYVCSGKFSDKLRYQEVGSKFIIDLGSEIDIINKEFIISPNEKFTPENTKLKVFDFCAARKYAGSCCKNKWVLSIDCDEVFSALDIKSINAIIESNEFTQCSFTFRYRDSNGHISSITSRDKLYNRDFADWKWLVHEQVKPLEGCSQKLANLSEDILALDHYQHEADHRSNYLLSMCVDVMKDPNDQHIFWLGRELHNRGYHHSACKLLNRYLKEYPNAWSAERCLAAVYMGDAHMDISKQLFEDDTLRKYHEVKALKSYFAGTVYEGTFREPWLRLGYHYVSKSQHDLGVTFITTAINIQTLNQNYVNDINYCYGSQPYMKLYISLYALGNKVAAHEVWKKAVSLFPKDGSITDHELLFVGM